MHGGANDRAEIDRSDRPRGAYGETVRLQRRDESRQPEALGDAAGDEPEQAFVPALRGKQQQRQRGIIAERCVGDGEGLRQHALLDGSPLGIERFELRGDPPRLDLIVSGEQPRTEAGRADPAARH